MIAGLIIGMLFGSFFGALKMADCMAHCPDVTPQEFWAGLPKWLRTFMRWFG